MTDNRLNRIIELTICLDLKNNKITSRPSAGSTFRKWFLSKDGVEVRCHNILTSKDKTRIKNNKITSRASAGTIFR